MATKMTREEAIKIVQSATVWTDEERDALSMLAPELAESEDERIRKWILNYAIEMIAGLESDISRSTYDGIKGHDPEAEAELAQWQKAKAYLEKQKEQKPSTPKYRVGDVMRTKQESAEGITDGLPVIVSVDDNYYYCTNEKIPISEQEEYEFPPMNMRQKPAEWSEEEKRKLNRIYSIIGWAMDEHAFSSCKKLLGDKEGIELQDFLRSIAKPKQEWSEENESVAYHYPEPVPPGVAYKSPQCYTDVLITPNTNSGTSTLKAEG